MRSNSGCSRSAGGGKNARPVVAARRCHRRDVRAGGEVTLVGAADLDVDETGAILDPLPTTSPVLTCEAPM